jgi:hypothetical protein
MTQGYCTDHAALIGFLYDDCEPDERERIAAHVAGCADCTAELVSLTATRRQLAAWVPPQSALGFQIDPSEIGESTHEDSRPPFQIVAGGGAVALGPAPSTAGDGPAREGSARERAAWWKQPLPAWAQAAAAVLIFAAGVGFGAGRTATDDRAAAPPRATASGARSTPVAATTAPVIAAGELARLEQKLQAMQAEITALRAAGSHPPAPGVTLAQVEELVTSTEGKLQNQIVLLDAAWQTARRSDMQQIGNRIDPLQRVYTQERWSQGEPVPSLGAPVIGLTRKASLTR